MKVEFDWLIHYRCNYRCPYCFFNGMWEEVEKRNHYLPLEKWIAAWQRIIKKYGEVHIIITGGEPFIYPSFLELIGELSKWATLGFDTNLSCSKEELIHFVEKTVPGNITLGLSFHPMFAEFHPFLHKALFLKKEGYHIQVHYVTYPPQLARMEYFRDRFREEGLYFLPLPFRGSYQERNYPQAYTGDEKRLIYQVSEELETKDKAWVGNQVIQPKSKGKLCRAGQVYARIDSDGKVFRCGRYASSAGNKPLGNFFDKNFELWKEPLPCEEEVCPCEFRWLIE